MSGKCAQEVNRLIAEVHRRPELWDRQHPQHHNRFVLDHHWDTVAASLGMTGKATRAKWKNLKDHFRKEYKRCMTSGDSDQDMSRWPYFQPMMFIREQISYTTAGPAAANNPAYLSDVQYENNLVPEVRMEVGSYGSGGGNGNPLSCLHAEYDYRNRSPAADANPEYSSHQDENMSDDKHFLLSLLPMFSVLPPDKKLKARIAIETCLLNIAYPAVLNPATAADGGSQVPSRGNTTDGSPRKADSSTAAKSEKRILRTSLDDEEDDDDDEDRPVKKRSGKKSK